MKNRAPDRIDGHGDEFWYDDDGYFPAIIYHWGHKEWYKHGIQHNDFGPAIIWSDGTKFWYIDGVKYTKREFKQYKIKNFINEE